MLTLKDMSWDNCFSYGDGNTIRFDENPLTQLVGVNGSGKTSISLMLQEVLYGKNNKNIKKQEIANNKSGKKGYLIELNFEKDGNEYRVVLDRKSSLKFRLYKNNKDISSHTSLNTYKTLGEIIGISDFKVFCQLIYQHSTDSLEFLTATDTNRKKFLISLLQLEKYIELHELFKDRLKYLTSDIASLQGSIGTIETWINKHKDMSFLKREPVPVPILEESWVIRKKELEENILNINSINRKIATNNQYKYDLNNLNPKYYLNPAPALPNPSLQELRTQVRILEKEYETHQTKINKLMKAVGECTQCLQQVDETQRERMVNNEIELRDKVKAKLLKICEKIPDLENLMSKIAHHDKERDAFEKLNQLIDSTLPEQTLDLKELNTELVSIQNDIIQKNNEINKAIEENKIISAHNSKVDVIKNQLDEMKKELHKKDVKLVEHENLQNILELLKKTFGTNGLVSYKIESSVKELEKKINYYLADLTHFQIYFKLSGEKLNIDVIDDLGNTTSISNLSSGERARVNLATLLGVRSILSSLTSTKINLLFLDEITGSLDAEGKEKFTEILLKENLNTFFVSHEWTHPLVPQIRIVKEHHISRIEND